MSKRGRREEFVGLGGGFDIGSTVAVDGRRAVIRMVTATQVLVHVAGSDGDEWVPMSSGRLTDPTTQLPLRPCISSFTGSAEGENGVDGSDLEDDECAVCGQGGKLTCCDVCPRVYHMRCLPASDNAALKQQVGAEDWWCPHCKSLSEMTLQFYRCLTSSPHGCSIEQRLFIFMDDAVRRGIDWEVVREAGLALIASLPGCGLPSGVGPATADGAHWPPELSGADWWNSSDLVVEKPPEPELPPPAEVESPPAQSIAPPALRTPAPVEVVSNGVYSGEMDIPEAPTSGEGGEEDAATRAAKRTSELRGVSKRYGKWKAGNPIRATVA